LHTSPSSLHDALPISCASSDDDVNLAALVEQTEPADVLYNQGLANLNAGRMSEAIAKFEAIDRQHPYSEFAPKALIMNTFANYRDRKSTRLNSSHVKT